MDTKTTLDGEIGGTTLRTKPENKKKVLLEHNIDAEKFDLSTSVCSDIVTYIRRGAMDSRYGTAERVRFVKDTLEKFFGHRVRYQGSEGVVVALRLKSLRRLAFERKTANTPITGVMEACVEYDKGRQGTPWVDTKRLTVID